MNLTDPAQTAANAARNQSAAARFAAGLSFLAARLTESEESRRQRRDEAYLAQATDLYDLEYRSRECDRRNRGYGGW